MLKSANSKLLNRLATHGFVFGCATGGSAVTVSDDPMTGVFAAAEVCCAEAEPTKVKLNTIAKITAERRITNLSIIAGLPRRHIFRLTLPGMRNSIFIPSNLSSASRHWARAISPGPTPEHEAKLKRNNRRASDGSPQARSLVREACVSITPP